MAIFIDEKVWNWVIANAMVESTSAGANKRTMVLANFVDTNWSDGNSQTDPNQRVDSFPDAILDFVFVAQGAREWRGRSRVIVSENDFPDTPDTSDHRPVEATFELSSN